MSDPRWSDLALTEILARSRAAGVTGWVLGGVNPAEWVRQRELRVRLGADVVSAIGLHPWYVAGAQAAELKAGLLELKKMLPEARALGELGLDFSTRVPRESRDVQREVFTAQLRLARESGVPIILHVVRAHEEALEILSSERVPEAGGLVHSFSDTAATARKYLDLGLKLSISGVITRQKGFETLKRAVVSIPPDSLCLETDCPDQPTERAKAAGRMGEPADLLEVAAAVAKLRGGTAEDWLLKSAANVRKLFRIS